ncbi:helix-turn-helix domain-containing protein [Mycolicibacterium arenosum]|uniref:XRE family transcriptional regulator n=1 Tax=Mycolicibacterium arenosum TaxID=2952157 RepID=A0ABT1LY24_9MYCO|nr:XRE family transcriptional regulator [Mycolicibacterium sp. CAU 1645]MCP9271245.1 XRE family transcriptional regulator [Mycolicibacterium sp. CAU 1645]
MRQEWADELHRRVAAAIKAARSGRSAQWLADETERIGFPITRAQIANYESGRKKGLDLTELLMLAAALRVPPVVLLFPDLPDGPVEALPGITVDSWDAAAWFSGEARAPDAGAGEKPETAESKRIWAVRERLTQLASIGRFYDWIKEIGKRSTPLRPGDPEMRAFKLQLESLRDEVARLEEIIRENGGVLDASSAV